MENKNIKESYKMSTFKSGTALSRERYALFGGTVFFHGKFLQGAGH
jgi:hypothetical protein